MVQPGAATRALRRLAPLALFGAALVMRVLRRREIVIDGQLLSVDPDVWYHLRRIAFGIHAFPAVLTFDPYLNFPYGAKPIWTPVFDWCAAALLRPFVRPFAEGGLADVERLAIWLPPLLGATTVCLLAWIGRRHFGSLAGWVAGIGLCILSGHIWYSQLGFVDHHVALGLAATALLGAGLGWIASEESGARGAAWVAAAACGAAAASTLAVWPGGLLHVSLVELCVIVFILTRGPAAWARAAAWRQAAAHALAALLIAPLSLGNEWPQWGRMSPVVLSDFQPWLFACIAAVWLACAAGWRGPLAGSRARIAGFALAVLAVGLASLVLLPELRGGADDAWRWLAKRESFQAQVAESQPLLLQDNTITLEIGLTRLSLFGLFFPFAGAWLAWHLRASRERARVFTALVFTAGLYAVTLVQRRFFDTACIGIALSLGLFARELEAAWRARGASARRVRAAVALAVAVGLLPTLRGNLRPLENEWNALRGRKLSVSGGFGFERAGLEVAAHLRAATPVTKGWLDVAQRPAYGVLAPWYLGHAIEYIGRRPTVVDNFGDDLGEESFDFVDRYFMSREPEIAFELERRHIRYVVTQRFPIFLDQKPAPASMFRALYARDGSARFDPESGALRMPALERHRLIYESLGRDFTDPDAAPVFKVFEFVAGAEVSGRAAPGAEIDVALALRTNRGRRFQYQTRVAADAEGRYRVRLPHATGGGPESLKAAPYYRFACGSEVAGLVVGEQAVQEGLPVEGPDLCLGAAKGAGPGAASDTGA